MDVRQVLALLPAIPLWIELVVVWVALFCCVYLTVCPDDVSQ